LLHKESGTYLMLRGASSVQYLTIIKMQK